MALTQQQVQEADRASQLFQAAMIAYGAQTFQDSLTLWEDFPSTESPDGAFAKRWMTRMIRQVQRRRVRSRDLALAYYRYQRAVLTGKTIALPGARNPERVELAELRRLFEAQLQGSPESPVEEQADNPPTSNVEAVTEEPEQPDEPIDVEVELDLDEDIEVEEVEGLEKALADMDRDAERELRELLESLGSNNLDKKVKRLPTDKNTPEARDKIHEKVGRRQSATAARSAMNGARGSLYLVADRDKKPIGFVRVSRTGTPCGWCAMLISRGFTPKSGLYKSDEGSGLKSGGAIVTYGDLDKYHDNCQCYAVPIFDREQLNSKAFAMNREYATLWPKVTGGLGGKDAVRAWRKHFRKQTKARKSLAAA